MRQPIQILAIPYILNGDNVEVMILKRRKGAYWQFVSGGKEYGESIKSTAKREIKEELGISVKELFSLKTKTFIPADIFENRFEKNPIFVIEHCFAFQLSANPKDIVLSNEHSETRCVSYSEAMRMLKWDSNKTAMYELYCRMNWQHQ